MVEMIFARQSPNVPDISTIAAGNDTSTLSTQEMSLSAVTSSTLAVPTSL
jgi:hypothetical protein